MRRRREHRLEQQRQRSNHEALINEFQPDAVEIEKRSVPGGARWTLYTVVALLITAVVWANWAEVDRIVKAEGKLVTTDMPIVIDAKLASPIASLNARFGDRVPAGFVIATMDPTFSDADLKQLETQQAALVSVQARLQAERDGADFDISQHQEDPDWLLQYQLFLDRKREYDAEMQKFTNQSETFRVQLENNESEIENNLKSHGTYVKTLAKTRELFRVQSASELDVLGWEMQVNDANMKVLTGRSKEKELNKSLETVDAERAAYQARKRAEVMAELVSTTDNLAGIEQEINKAKRSNQFVELRVPDDLPYQEFVVLETTDKSVGSTMQPGEPLFRLIPVGAPMELEIEVQGRDIARLKVATAEQMESGDLPGGSDVRIKLKSFPYQKHGALEGAVRTISEGSFEKTLANGQATGVTMYKARVRIFEPYELEEVPEDFRLMPGMGAEAEIKIGRRKVIEYFLNPLIRSTEALREP